MDLARCSCGFCKALKGIDVLGFSVLITTVASVAITSWLHVISGDLGRARTAGFRNLGFRALPVVIVCRTRYIKPVTLSPNLWRTRPTKMQLLS